MMTVPPKGQPMPFRRWVSSFIGFFAASMRKMGSDTDPTGYEVML
jgi:hypothetical protein